MRIFTFLGIIFYSVILTLIGLTLIVYAVNILQPQDINAVLLYTQTNLNSKVAIGFAGLLLILLSFFFAQLIIGRFQREKNIAFTTSSGEVTISLSAVEDLIKRMAYILPEIKELKPDVIATKKGIVVDLRLVLRSEANIPELTARLQDITRAKIQEVLGIEEQIIIKIHVTKIISAEEKDKKKKEIEKPEPTIPFGGYGRA